MSEFKVGDRARIAVYGGFSTANDHLGKEGTITFIYSNRNCELKTDEGLRYGPLKDLVPLITEGAPEEAEDLIGISKEDADTKFSDTFLKPKTYTLTPYIKPETVTINGVEYIMTENV